MKKYIYLLFLIASCSVWAHDVREVYYDFQFEKDFNTLIVHLTTKGAIDVLKEYNPAYENKTIFDFKEHTAELESYFNTHIQLYGDNRKISLKLISYDLVSHDALLVFDLKNTPLAISQLTIKNTAFTDVYRDAENYMSFTTNGEKKEMKAFKDTGTQSVYFNSVRNPQDNIQTSGFSLYAIAIVSVIISAVTLIYLNRKV